MTQDLNQLRRERGRLFERMKAISDCVESEHRRNLTAAEASEFKDLEAQQERLFHEIQRGESEFRSTGRIVTDGAPSDGYSYRSNPNGGDTRTAYNRYLLSGPNALSATEYRALQSDSDTGGGYLVAPMQVASEYIRTLMDELFALKPGFCRVVEMEKAETSSALSRSYPPTFDRSDPDEERRL